MKKIKPYHLISFLGFLIAIFKIKNFPIFCDEAIYIRWSQLIKTDPLRFIYLPINDGKPPIFFIILSFFQIFKDYLFFSRLISSLSFMLLLFFIYKFTLKFTKHKKYAYIAILLSLINPFFIFFSKLALIDMFLTTLLMISFYFYLNSNFILSGIFFGLSLLTKTSAILLFPTFVFLSLLFDKKRKIKSLLTYIYTFITVSFIIIFKNFPQLFKRSSDFLFQKHELLADNDLLKNILNRFLKNIENLKILVQIEIFIYSIFAFFNKQKKQIFILICIIFSFLFTISTVGKTVHIRYFLPIIPFIIILASIGFIEFAQKNPFTRLLLIILLFLYIKNSFIFYFHLTHNFNKLKLPEDMRSQYLTSWSSGIGIKETNKILENIAKTKKVLVLTEGSFGTLPDAIFIHFSNTNLPIEIIGTGKVEFKNEQIKALKKYKNNEFDAYIFIVNSNRLKTKIPYSYQIANFKKSDSNSQLLIIDITNFIKS